MGKEELGYSRVGKMTIFGGFPLSSEPVDPTLNARTSFVLPKSEIRNKDDMINRPIWPGDTERVLPKMDIKPAKL